MKLFNFATYEDYGKEFYLQLLSHYPHFAFLDVRIQWDEFPATGLFPLLVFSIGSISLCGFSFRYKWFELRLDIFQTSPRDLKKYQENDKLEGT